MGGAALKRNALASLQPVALINPIADKRCLPCKAVKLIGEAFLRSAVMCAHFSRLSPWRPRSDCSSTRRVRLSKEAPFSAATAVLSFFFSFLFFSFFVFIFLKKGSHNFSAFKCVRCLPFLKRQFSFKCVFLCEAAIDDQCVLFARALTALHSSMLISLDFLNDIYFHLDKMFFISCRSADLLR